MDQRARAPAPLILEIGFGNGEQLLWSSLHEPDCDFLGIEVHRPGVGRLMNALAANNVNNVRLYNHDAVSRARAMHRPASLAGVRITSRIRGRSSASRRRA